jgi:trafficking protein particle complex subunit 8
VTYEFLSLLPTSESLASRGPRLQETALQRQVVAYGSDLTVVVEVEEANQKVLVDFVDDSRLVLLQGERRRMKLWLSNTGTRSVGEVWMMAGTEDEIWVDFHSSPNILPGLPLSTEILHSDNSILPQQPFLLPLDNSLAPGDSIEFAVVLHADRISEHDLCLFFVFREAQNQSFHSARVTRYYEVVPIFEVSANSQPSRSVEHLFLLNLEVANISSGSEVQLTQITTLSPLWECTPVMDDIL